MVAVARAPIAVAPNVSMSQSGLMVAALLGGFVVFIAMQGKLANYWSILLGGGSTATSGATTTPAAPSTGSGSTAPSASPFSFLGGTANPTAPATGGTGTATPTGIPGLPNVSLGNFFGLQ
jgi:hypothetical protein